MLKKYLISLDKDIQRRKLFFSQKNTEDFQIFSAINTMQKDWDELASIFNIEQFKAHYFRNVTKGEIGCTLSHLSVYQKIIEDNDIAEDSYALVCEDDALFHSDFQQNLTALLSEKLEAEI
ncbi:TPA: lipooligosaccharide biosynthesis galactosyltransferase LsgD, partial [Haemophilus influenzae]